MKKTIYLLNLVPLIALGQIPVTDAATNGSLGIANNQLTQTHMQLRSLGNRLATTNRKLDKLIDLIEKNNDHTSKSREILKEELDAKKTAPDYVLRSTELSNIIELKDKILETYRSTQEIRGNFKNMDSRETDEFIEFASNTVMGTNKLFEQGRTILNTRSILPSEERLKKINDIAIKLDRLLEGLVAYNKRMKRLDASRGIRKTLIDLN